jgi:hypothetical protein
LWSGLAAVAILSLLPLLAEPLPVDFVPAYASPLAAWGSKAVVVLAMLLAIGLCAWVEQRREPSSFPLALLFLVAAGLMTAWHWHWPDSNPYLATWQKEMYLDILNHRREAPHQYRPLPYGFTRSLEIVTGDWTFSCIAYRWFFTFWFLWGAYRLARMWHSPERSLLTVVPLVLLYPLSIWYYWGQLTDPLSHSLFLLAVVCALEDRWLLLAAALALGVVAKETVLLMAPVYFACWWRQGLAAWVKCFALGVVCIAAYFATRLPLGWQLGGYRDINDTERLMVFDNLGIGEPYYNPAAPLYQNYLHVALFVGVFLPFIVWGWRRIDPRLRTIAVTLTPLVLLSNLCFGWMYESRNYMPLVPILATAALSALAGQQQHVVLQALPGTGGRSDLLPRDRSLAP